MKALIFDLIKVMYIKNLKINFIYINRMVFKNIVLLQIQVTRH